MGCSCPGLVEEFHKHSHDVLHRSRLDEHGDGVQLSQLEPLDGVSRHVQDAVFPLSTKSTDIFVHCTDMQLQLSNESWTNGLLENALILMGSSKPHLILLDLH